MHKNSSQRPAIHIGGHGFSSGPSNVARAAFLIRHWASRNLMCRRAISRLLGPRATRSTPARRATCAASQAQSTAAAGVDKFSTAQKRVRLQTGIPQARVQGRWQEARGRRCCDSRCHCRPSRHGGHVLLNHGPQCTGRKGLFGEERLRTSEARRDARVEE